VRVLLLSRYGVRGASSRVRMYQYLGALATAGIEVTPAPLLTDADSARRHATGRYTWRAVAAAAVGRVATLASRRRYDALWIEYELLPFVPALVERILVAGGPPYVVEYDDAIFHRYDQHRSAVVRRLLGTKIDDVMRRAAVVVAGNGYLADRARTAGARDVVTVPSVVDLDRYPLTPLPAVEPRVIGWIGSPSTTPSLATVEGALTRVCAGGRARVVLVGSGPGPHRRPYPCEERPWVDGREAADIASFDVGIMPLADDPWSRGKCGYKLIQYLACGRPAAASPVGMNPEIVVPEVTGLLASTEDEWVAALERLLGDSGLRARLGQAGRAHVAAHFTLTQTVPVVAAALRRAAGGAPMCAA
jgi:glycosyltransferase involved in cell wall biosynthesis